MTSRDVYFFGNACAFSSRKAVSVPTSVIGGLGAPWRSANLLDACHTGSCKGAEHMSACGWLCASWRRFLHIGLHVKPRLHAWHSHRQSRSHFAFSSLSDQGEIRVFFIFWNSFLYKITVSFTMVIKRSPGGQACRWRAVNFEIHLWSSSENADCIFGDRSASSMSK